MRSTLFQLLCVTATLGAAATADAKPRGVVVLEFDGPRQLADSGRSAVMSVLGEQYNIVATRSWDTARAHASGRGPQQWREASKQTGADAVIEGWVQAEGKHHVLTIAVKDAATGQEIDTLSVRLKDRSVTTETTHRIAAETTHRIAAELDDLLSWIDSDVTAEPSKRLPEVRAERTRSTRKSKRIAEDVEDDDQIEVADDEVAADDNAEDADDAAEPERPRKKAKAKRAKKAPPRVAAVGPEDSEINDLVALFGPESKEAAIVTDGKTAHVPRPTPRFTIGAGPYLSARGMTFQYDVPNASSPRPPEYPASLVKGFAAHAAVFPMPHAKQDGKPSGVGFSVDVAKSVASVLTVQNNMTGEFRDCTIDQTSWQLAAHYRWPIDFVAVGIQGNFGKTGHVIVDVPEDLGFADTGYSYVGAGANVELAVTDRATVGFNARYMYLLAAGNVTDEMAYGAGKAYGLALGGEFVIPLPGALYVRGAVDYQRFAIELEGSGELTKQWGVWNVVDAAITGSASLGVSF